MKGGAPGSGSCAQDHGGHTFYKGCGGADSSVFKWSLLTGEKSSYTVHGLPGMKTGHSCSGEVHLLVLRKGRCFSQGKKNVWKMSSSHKGNRVKKVVLVFYCCVMSDHKASSLKQHRLAHSSEGQKSHTWWLHSLLSGSQVNTKSRHQPG